MRKCISTIVLMATILNLLTGCTVQNQSEQKHKSSEHNQSKKEETTVDINKLSSLHEISISEVSLSDKSKFFDLEGNPIDMREISLKRGEYYIIDESSISISEVILSPIKIDANYKVLKEQVVEFANLASYSSVENDNIKMRDILQRIIGFNTILPISHNLSQIQFIPSSDIVITIYFYPICYKVDAITDSFYTLKGAHQFDGLYCDGIYEIRIVE